jgi:hypothetical protein
MTRTLLSLVLLLLGAVPAWASGDMPDATPCTSDLSGSWRGGYFSSSADFGKRDGVVAGGLWLKPQLACGDEVSITAEGWVATQDALHGDDSRGRLREAFLDWHPGAWSVRLGRQIIIWGRADRFNPTDNLTPRDYTLMAPEDTDQRTGVDAAKVTRRFGGVSLTGIAMFPQQQSNKVPIAVPPGVSLTERRGHGPQGALRLDQSGGDVDWSVSYFNGFDLNPNFGLRMPSPAAPPGVVLTHPRISVLGSDVATVWGRYGLRAEAAYTWTDNRGEQDWLTKKPYFYMVAGGDRTFDSDLNVNVQFYMRQVAHHRSVTQIDDPLVRSLATQAAISWNQLESSQYGATVRVADKWFNDVLEGEIALMFAIGHREYVFRPRLVYHVNDRVKMTLGMDRYGGTTSSFFGQLRPLSSTFIECQFGF